MTSERTDRVGVVVAAGIAACMGAYLYTFLAPVAVWWYEPIQRTWVYGLTAGPVAMDFYGRVALALLWGLGAAAGTLILTAGRPRRLGPGSFIPKMISGYAVLLTIVTLLSLAWLFTHRRIVPEVFP